MLLRQRRERCNAPPLAVRRRSSNGAGEADPLRRRRCARGTSNAFAASPVAQVAAQSRQQRDALRGQPSVFCGRGRDADRGGDGGLDAADAAAGPRRRARSCASRLRRTSSRSSPATSNATSKSTICRCSRWWTARAIRHVNRCRPSLRRAVLFDRATTAAYLGGAYVIGPDGRGDRVAEWRRSMPRFASPIATIFWCINAARPSACISRIRFARGCATGNCRSVSRGASTMPKANLRGVALLAIRIEYFQHLLERIDTGELARYSS